MSQTNRLAALYIAEDGTVKQGSTHEEFEALKRRGVKFTQLNQVQAVYDALRLQEAAARKNADKGKEVYQAKKGEQEGWEKGVGSW